jgi:hypothetical protein
MPTKIIVTHNGELKKKYGAKLSAINQAITLMTKADAARGITTTFVAIDDASFGQSRATRGKLKSFKDAVDYAYSLHQNPDYILILGGPDIVPHQRLKNLLGPDEDDDRSVPSDLPYACDAPYSTQPQAFIGPTRAVGRLPDLQGTRDPALLVSLLKAASVWKPKARPSSAYFGLSAAVWKGSTDRSLQALFGKSASSRVSPIEAPPWKAGTLKPHWHFINCHGAPADPQFYGQKGSSYPVAVLGPDLAKKVTTGTVVAAECCYGAELYDPALATAPAICISYLQNGAIGFVGSTTVAYGPARTNGLADLVCRYFVEEARAGASLGSALLSARVTFAHRSGPLSPVDLKTLAQFLLLGDPSLRAVARKKAAGSGKTTAANAMASHVKRRAAIAANATVVTRGAAVAESTASAGTDTIHAELAAVAKNEGYRPEARVRTFHGRSGTDPGARALMPHGMATRLRFHVLSARPTHELHRAADEATTGGRKALPGRTERIPKRLLVVGQEVGGKMVKVERLYAHLLERAVGQQSFEGRVVRRRRSPGSKSDRDAVVLETGAEDLILRRLGGNAFSDPILDALVGRRIRGNGQRTGVTFIMTDWTDIDT